MDSSGMEGWKATEFARLLALVETERRYFQQVFAFLPFPAAVFDHNLKLQMVNQEFRRRFALATPDLQQINFANLLPEERTQSAAQDALLSSQPLQTPAFEIMTNLGRRWFTAGMLRIRNPRGDGWDLLTVLSERSSAEQAPAAAPPVAGKRSIASAVAAAYGMPGSPPARRAADSLDALFWELEPQGRTFRSVGARASDITGIRREDWLTPAQLCDRFVHPIDREAYLRFYQSDVDNQPQSAIEYRILLPGQPVRWLRDEVRQNVEGGAIRSFAGMTLNVTTRRKEEIDRQESAKRDAVDHIAGRMAHVANNLLMIIEGYASDLQASLPESDPRRGDLEEILRAGGRMASFTRELSQIIRPPVPTHRVFDLREWMQTTVTRLCNQSGLPMERVNFVLPPRPLPVRAVPELLDNILSEALRLVLPEMRADSDLWLEPGREGYGRMIAVTLRFGNVHLPAELRRLFFEPFAGKKEPGVDPPFGLAAYVRQLELLGGRARLEGEPGEDPALVLVLERAESMAPPAPAPASRAPRNPQGSPAYTILLVDDEHSIRTLVKKALQREGYEVLDAGTTTEALEIARTHPAALDLLITDVQLPETGGRILAENVLATRSSTRVLFITGHSDDPLLDERRLPQGLAMLKKPFSLPELFEKVRQLLSGQASAAGA